MEQESDLARLNLLPLFFCCFRGFCYFNSVAIAAKLLQQRLNVNKILIVDWVSLTPSLSCGAVVFIVYHTS